MSVVLSVSNAMKSIGPRTLFKELTFGMNKGDRVGLVGPNGSGKSSLLRCLAGEDSLDSGNIIWSGRVSRVYVSQSPRAYQGLTIREFLSGKIDLDTKAESYAWELMSKLGSQSFDWEQLFSSLSGGEQKKLQIVKAFLQHPDIVLMDEPTNHLDIDSINLLEEFLESQNEVTVLVISHDRLFLQSVVKEVMDLDARYRDGYLRINGGYAEYLEASTEMFRAQNVAQTRMENDMRRETEWLRRGAIARLKKQKARQDSARELIEDVAQLSELNRKRTIDINLKSDDRIPKKLIEIENLSLSRGDKELFKNLSLVVSRGSRIGLLGSNGSGKSSFIRALLDKPSVGLNVDSGSIKRFDELKYSYFEQQRELLDFEKTLLQNICPMGDYVHVHGQPMHARSYMDRFRFRRDQHDLKVKELSGGEQNRLLIAKLMTEKVQLMVLDEPTNDLDFETLASLKKSLTEFDGAVILVSHDRAFMDEVCDQILYFNEETKKLVMYSSFYQWQLDRWNPSAAINQPVPAEVVTSVSNGGAGKTKSKRKLSYKEQKEFDEMEAVILAKETQLSHFQNELSLPEVQVNSSKLLEVTKSIFQLEAEIETLYARWQELSG